MKYTLYILLLIFGIGSASTLVFAQKDSIPTDDLGNVSDKYQDLFFEALKQRGIENYDKAVNALLLCIEIDDSNSILYFELGKNYTDLNLYTEAEDAISRAIKKEPENEWYLYGLYEVYFKQRSFKKAIDVVKKLIPQNKKYKKNLANLYYHTQQYDEALATLKEMNKETGVTTAHKKLRNRIYKKMGRKTDSIAPTTTTRTSSNNLESITKTIQEFINSKNYQLALEASEKALEKYPSQPEFYLLNGIALNNLQKPNEAIEILEAGLDFIIDNPKTEVNFYEQLSTSHSLLNNTSKAKTFKDKAKKVLSNTEKFMRKKK